MPSAAPVEPVLATPLDIVAAEFGMGAGRRDWDADDSVVREASRDVQKVIEVQRGDTLYGVLVEAGLSETEAKDTVGALADVFSPRSLKAGQEITLNMTTASGERRASLTPPAAAGEPQPGTLGRARRHRRAAMPRAPWSPKPSTSR